MKRQFVELLSDAHFVPHGLHSRKIEQAGKQVRNARHLVARRNNDVKYAARLH